MSDEQAADAPEPQPEVAEAKADSYSDPHDPPCAGMAALHYAGEEPIEREGFTFGPDQLVIVPEETAYKLAGKDNLRIVIETPETWGNYVALRARARG